MSGNFDLTREERLKLHQLRQVSFWQSRGLPLSSDGFEPPKEAAIVPARWELTRGVALHDWQRQCVNAWFANGRRGVIKVVTGAGKTILALAIAERLQQE